MVRPFEYMIKRMLTSFPSIPIYYIIKGKSMIVLGGGSPRGANGIPIRHETEFEMKL